MVGVLSDTVGIAVVMLEETSSSGVVEVKMLNGLKNVFVTLVLGPVVGLVVFIRVSVMLLLTSIEGTIPLRC